MNGVALTNERWLKWAVACYYRSLGYEVSMKPARAGNAMVDGVALSPEGERIAIEVKSPSDDIIRGVGQCYEALANGYNRAVLSRQAPGNLRADESQEMNRNGLSKAT